MTNEQRETVDRLERYLIADKINLYTTVRTDDLDTVLSLIKEQQDTIKELKEKLILENKAKNKAEEECKRLWYISSYTCYYDMQEEIKKKDKIIGKMIDNIMTHYQVKTIRKMCCPTCKIGERACTYSGIHRNCVKHYFENKVNSSEQ